VDRVVRFVGPGAVDVVESPRPEPADGQILVRTLYCGISAGTELTAYLGTSPYLHRQWDADRRRFLPGAHTVDYPVEGRGYEEVGVVERLGAGVTGLAPGDTHVLPVEETARAFELVAERPADLLQAVLDFRASGA
jgi:threonine dehydrogenase-like Zn-dependent dehydrogenase